MLVITCHNQRVDEMMKYQSSCAKLSPFFGRRKTPYRDNDISLENTWNCLMIAPQSHPNCFNPPPPQSWPPGAKFPCRFAPTAFAVKTSRLDMFSRWWDSLAEPRQNCAWNFCDRQAPPTPMRWWWMLPRKWRQPCDAAPQFIPLFLYWSSLKIIFFLVGHQLEHPFNGHAAPENHSTSFSARARLRDYRWKLASLALWLATPQKDAEKSIFQDVSSMIFKFYI
jgi:hypothetical protein